MAVASPRSKDPSRKIRFRLPSFLRVSPKKGEELLGLLMGTVGLLLLLALASHRPDDPSLMHEVTGGAPVANWWVLAVYVVLALAVPPLAPMMRSVDEELVDVRGFPILDRAEVPAATPSKSEGKCSRGSAGSRKRICCRGVSAVVVGGATRCAVHATWETQYL